MAAEPCVSEPPARQIRIRVEERMVRSIPYLLLAMCAMSSPCTAEPMELDSCLSSLRSDATSHGISSADFDRLTRSSVWQSITVEKSQKQAEFTIDWPTYLQRVVSAKRIATGRELMTTWKEALNAVSTRYGVDPAVVVAIWGIESNYGQSVGDVPVLDAWITRSCLEPQKSLWRENVYASIRLLRDGIVDPDAFNGSWSGAFGLTQFIPTSFEKYARDGDGDGRIDLYGSVPDALASTANHLASRTRWLRGVPAAIEVRLPLSLLAEMPQESGEQRDPRVQRLDDWAARGVTRIDGEPLPLALDAPQPQASAFFPEGLGGRVFLITSNFDALLVYNRSTKYALSVALIAAAIETR
ncbi:MAG: lytic murein transglycosylase [Caldimonas sp.]